MVGGRVLSVVGMAKCRGSEVGVSAPGLSTSLSPLSRASEGKMKSKKEEDCQSHGGQGCRNRGPLGAPVFYSP